MEQKKRPGATTSVRVPEQIDRVWEGLSTKMSLNKTAVLVVALRELAKKEGMEVTEGEAASG